MRQNRHDWRSGANEQWCGNLGCSWRRSFGVNPSTGRTFWRYRDGADGPTSPGRKTMPPCLWLEKP